MNDRTLVGPKLILGRHTGGGASGENTREESPTLVQPDRFGLPDHLIRELVHPITNLVDPTKQSFVVGEVANYSARLVRLMNAATQIESAVKVVLEQFSGKLRVISFAVNSDKVCFEEIKVKVEINGEPLHPNEPRPNGLCVAVRVAIMRVLKPLGIAVTNIIIPSDYSESHVPREIQKDGPPRPPGPIEPLTAKDKTCKGEKLRPIDNFPYE